MEYQRRADGSIAELPPAVLDCGHPNGPRLSLVGYEWSPEHGRRTRTFYCRTCGPRDLRWVTVPTNVPTNAIMQRGPQVSAGPVFVGGG